MTHFIHLHIISTALVATLKRQSSPAQHNHHGLESIAPKKEWEGLSLYAALSLVYVAESRKYYQKKMRHGLGKNNHHVEYMPTSILDLTSSPASHNGSKFNILVKKTSVAKRGRTYVSRSEL
jgi:hypothetical protein